MRVLTKLEKNEFSKTFDFINYYIGSAVHFGDGKSNVSVTDIFFDGKRANEEIIKFISNNFKSLKEVNNLFNNSTAEKYKATMDRLIAYCFRNRVQPHRLRMIDFDKYEIRKNDAIPVIYEFGSEK